MGKADEMFEELGYEKTRDSEKYINYRKSMAFRDFTDIEFNLQEKTVLPMYENNVFKKITYQKIDMKELKAINEKCKELGWLDEK